MDRISLHMNATLGGANLHPVAKILHMNTALVMRVMKKFLHMSNHRIGERV